MSALSLNSKQSTILVIDDTPANLQVLMGLLSERGYEVCPMPSGKLALQGIHLDDYPDLILLDIQMPDLNGYEVCNQLKSDDRTRDIPVIFISALDDIFDKTKAFEVGGVDYITKPFQAEEVFMRVKTHLTLARLQKNLQQENKEQDRQLKSQNFILEKTVDKLQQANQELKVNLEELQATQLQLVQSEKMATLGQLVAGVAHEINNPIAFIDINIHHALGYVSNLIELVQLYQEEISTPNAKIGEYLEEIDFDFLIEDLPKTMASMQTGSERIRAISRSLRTFSRTDSDRKISFNLHEGIESTLLILKHRLKDNGWRPEIQVLKDYGDLPEINCFPGQLNQVCMNLLSNAIDALDEAIQYSTYNRSPKITIETDLSATKNRAMIWIKDNGMGMSEEVKSKAFDRLFTTKEVGKGTGLGLSIAREIIEKKHGGKMWFESEWNYGTKFAIALPLA
ncbi:hybrid sensor histidine kinase/response regulator [Roseofilum casamattae]|uniref:histidine kinase n=1 Tax=Roseofilum casamattae BLCC-M143 TaxID=3022442 RepID=A0ABT7BXG3_9CYAN|nr:response regulator [Roseofilum casamattae]MDJ1182978.1 response regulator [Roseofilum casamattae BLCC-M143]